MDSPLPNTIPITVQDAFEEANRYFPTPIQLFQFLDKYSRFDYSTGRRETWIETVNRAMLYLIKLSQFKLQATDYGRIRQAILDMKAAPSMRLLAMAGPAAERQNISIYNCSYLPLDSIDSLVEELIIAMAGCVSGDTLIQTTNGPKRADSLKDAPYTALVDGKEYFAPRGTFISGTKQLYKLKTKLGYEMRLTAEHPLLTKSGWKQLEQISVGDEIKLSQQKATTWGGQGTFAEGYLSGIFIGDGEWRREQEAKAAVKNGDKGHEGIMQEAEKAIKTVSRRSIAGGWFKHRDGHDLSIGTMVTRFGLTRESTRIGEGLRGKAIPESIELTSSDFQKGFLRGLFDTDGGVIMSKKHRRVMLFQSYRPNLVRVQRMLSRFGIRSKITKRSDAGKMTFPGGRECECQERWMLSIIRDSIPVFAREIDFSHTLKKHKLYEAVNIAEYWTRSQIYDVVVAIEEDTVEEVWDTIIEDVHAFDANGIYVHNCGVGYSVERQYVDQLPKVEIQRGFKDFNVPIEDSTEGWADAFRKALRAWMGGVDISFDYSRIRPTGTPLKIKGGRASGPEHLMKLMDFTRKVILARQGCQLRPIDVHDIACKVGEAVVSGGVRRTALIALFDYDDEQMRNCKNGDAITGNEQRWMANNSAVWPEGITNDQIAAQMQEMRDGMRGEPGIFSRHNANSLKPARRKEAVFGTNPSLRRGTLVYTAEGIFPIEQLEGRTFFTRNLNGQESQAECFLSGKDKPLYEVALANGQSYFATKEHKWPVVSRYNNVRKVTSDELKPGMYLPVLKKTSLDFGTEGTYDEGFLAGWITGDGWMLTTQDGHKQVGLILAETDLHLREKLEAQLVKIGCHSKFQKRQRDKSVWYEINTQANCLAEWCEKFGVQGKRVGVPSSIWTTASEDFRKGFIDGLFSSDGHISDRLVLTSSHKQLVEEVQSLLGFYGINGIIRSSESVSNFPNEKDYQKKYQRYDLRINAKTNIAHFATTFTLSHEQKNQRLQEVKGNRVRGLIRIKDVRLTELKEDVWDISVYDDTHCFQLAYSMTGNCGEINLRPYQFCNLSIAIARAEDTEETLREKVEIATIIGTIQSMATNFPGLRDIWRKNCEEERLLGVDINGWLDSKLLQPSNPNLPKILERLKNHAVKTNKKYAKILGIPQSTSVTCVKPSGNSGILFNCASGLHGRWAPYYIRNARVQAQSPLRKLMQDQGVIMVPELGQTVDDATTYVVSFPMKAPDGGVTKDDLSALDQCEYWLKAKKHWTEHNPSVTITYKPDEFDGLLKWVLSHKAQIGGMSFLPAFDAEYDLMPNIEITKEQYDALIEKFPKIDWANLYLYEKEDFTTASSEVACVSGACSLEDYQALQASKQNAPVL